MINRKGSTAVLLAITFVSMMIAVVAAIGISRLLVVKSECQVFGNVWTRAILSEYDRHLLEDYGIMAYRGPDSEVDKRLDVYMEYSMSGKLDATIGKADSYLAGFEMNDPDNFSEAIKKGFATSTVESIVSGGGRTIRPESDRDAARPIVNRVVLDTMPSGRMNDSIEADALVESLKSGDMDGVIRGRIGGAVAEIAMINRCFDSHMTIANDKPAYMTNEWEYIVRGSSNDEENFNYCRRRIFLIRNALDLVHLETDPEKQALLLSVSELIAPGPGGVVVKLLLTELWAAAEAKYDVEMLLDGGRIPAMKTSATWHTDLEGIINDSTFRGKLDEEARELLDENSEEIREISKMGKGGAEIAEGQTYDDYILLFILVTNSSTRLLRIMDLVQMEMKYRYYSDFNLEEYYKGVRFNINANGRTYSFEDEYK